VAGATFALSVVLALALLLPGFGAAPFDDPGEGQHAEIAHEMLASGDWLSPTLNGVRYVDKPPLLYWLAAGAFSIVGVHEWAARLPSILGAAVAVAATAWLGSRLLGPAGGLLAAGGLLSCALFVAFARYVRPETLFVAAIQCGFTGLLLAVRDTDARRGRLAAIIGCGALGIAAITKDPLGLVGPLMVMALALALAGRVRPLSRWLPPAGVVLLVVLGVGWYVATALRQPGFAWYTIVDNHLLNAVRLRQFPDEDIPLTTPEFLAVSLLGAIPTVIAAAWAIASLVRRRAWRDPADIAWTTLALWATGILALFALVAFKLPQYGLPAYPALALLAARAWRDRAAPARGLIVAHLLVFALIAACCGLAAAGDGRVFLGTVVSVTDVYTRKQAALSQNAPFPPWSALLPLVARTALVFGLGSVVLLLVLVRRAFRLAPWAVVATTLAAMPAVTSAVSLVGSSRAVRGIAAEIHQEIGSQDVLVHEGPIENSGALELYAGRRPILLDARRSVLGFGATFPGASATFWDAERFVQEWCSGRHIVLVTPRAPDQSLVRRLPPDRLQLRAVDNGRWLYQSVPGAPGGTCASSSPR